MAELPRSWRIVSALVRWTLGVYLVWRIYHGSFGAIAIVAALLLLWTELVGHGGRL